MTRRARRQDPPEFAGDFTPGDRDITRVLPDYDGTTWEDASGQPHVPDTEPIAITRIRAAGYETWAVHRARLALAPPVDCDTSYDATGWDEEPPRRELREPDLAMFRRVGDVWTLLCGLCPAGQRAGHSDTATGRAERMFEALRASARAAGWRTDLFKRWACPPCQDTPAFWPAVSITCSSVTGKDAESWAKHRRRDGEQGSSPAAQAREYGDVSGEWWHVIVADEQVFERRRDAAIARQGMVVIRPDGRFVSAWPVRGEPVKDARPGRHRAAES